MIALLLLVIITLLASTGMRMSVAELVMAGNEQFRHRASTASSAGIEVAIARISARKVGVSGSVEGIGPAAVGPAAADSYAVKVRYAGREASLPGSSVEKFSADHLEINSVGTSVRNARDEQVQGVMVISVVNGVRTFRRAGDGLSGAASP